MFCCHAEDFHEEEDRIEYQSSPLKVKLLEAFGLKTYAINRFVFARPQPTYKISTGLNQPEFTMHGIVNLAPFGYTQSFTILNGYNVSVPLAHLKPISRSSSKSIIIFSHGNGSDLSQALTFISSLAELHQCEYIAYDYSGYGVSEQKNTSSMSICDDLEMILAWLDRPLKEVILIGFSLGCYPTAKIASKYRVKAVILISPMMSLISLLSDQSKLGVNTFFKNDEFNLFEVVENIESHLLLVHSAHDEIIPFRHSQLIYDRYRRLSNNQSIDLLQVLHLSHNEVLTVLQSTLQNQLQKEFFGFLKKVEEKETVDFYIQRKQQSQLEKRGKFGIELLSIIKQDTEGRNKSIDRATATKLTKLRDTIKKS